MPKITAFDYTRMWFDFAFENPDLVTGNHTAVYLWQVELCNRLGWSEKFGTPASETMRATGIKSYNTYKKIFDDLCSWGCIKLIKKSINQHQANVIALSNFNKALNKALDKALDKALMNHLIKHSESTVQSTDDINKPQTVVVNNTTTKPQTILVWEQQKKFSDNAKETWLILCSSTKWKKKSERALTMCLKQLLKYDELFAIHLMEQSIANDYQGIVFGNTDRDYKIWKEQNAPAPVYGGGTVLTDKEKNC